MYILYLYELNIVLGPKQEIATASEDIASHKHCHGPVFFYQQHWHMTGLQSTQGCHTHSFIGVLHWTYGHSLRISSFTMLKWKCHCLKGQ
jgi:hypothetical protein